MREKLWIYGGLLLFLIGVTYPVWRNAITHASTRPPDLVMPVNQKQCVAPVSYMRTSHMKLLIAWRKSVVRDNDWFYHSFDGKVYKKGLSSNCLKCHSKSKFCDRCHTYVGTRTPYCWNCHVDPALVKGATP